MAEDIRGYVTHTINRNNAGSGTPSLVVFDSVMQAVSLDNFGSTGVFYKFDGTADTGSTSGFLPASSFRAFLVRLGSVSLLGVSGTTPSVQVVGVR